MEIKNERVNGLGSVRIRVRKNEKEQRQKLQSMLWRRNRKSEFKNGNNPINKNN